MSGIFWATVANAFRRTALPLISYYTITLGVPIANDAALFEAAFVRHATVVLVVPAVAIALAGAVHSQLRRGK